MGSFDGAETCELIGLFILSHLKFPNTSVGLYQDDGLLATSLRPRQTQKLCEQISTIFKGHGLNITSEANLKIVNFLDITLNLDAGTFSPYTKPNNEIYYVHSKSNHPPAVKKNIPLAVNDRLSTLSSNENVFNQNKKPYQKALDECGYTHKLVYNPPQQNTKNKNRSRKVLWFTPPYSVNIKTRVGAKFLKLVDKCFPKSNPLSKIFNRRTLKTG